MLHEILDDSMCRCRLIGSVPHAPLPRYGLRPVTTDKGVVEQQHLQVWFEVSPWMSVRSSSQSGMEAGRLPRERTLACGARCGQHVQ